MHQPSIIYVHLNATPKSYAGVYLLLPPRYVYVRCDSTLIIFHSCLLHARLIHRQMHIYDERYYYCRRVANPIEGVILLQLA